MSVEDVQASVERKYTSFSFLGPKVKADDRTGEGDVRRKERMRGVSSRPCPHNPPLSLRGCVERWRLTT